MAMKSSVTNQTLDRGLLALTMIARATEPPSINELAVQLDVHRSMAYRIVRTLEGHGLSRRDGQGRCHPGHALAGLSRAVERSLREVARPELERMSDSLNMTTFIAVASGNDALTIDSAEPVGTDSVISYRPGTRHRLDRGAPGLAILAGRAEQVGERSEVTAARRQGWAQSTGEVITGLGSLATWVVGDDGQVVASVACLFPGQAPDEPKDIIAELRRSADAIGRRLDEGA